MEWAVIRNGATPIRHTTLGFNPNYADVSLLERIVKQDIEAIPTNGDEIHYFGTGCGLEANKQLISTVLKSHFPQAEIEVETDMMGAARGMFGDQKGIACILGTGANSCLYDGYHVVDQAVSLGYLLGDEGSGCYIGRKIVRAYFYGLMPLQVKLSFEDNYKLSINDLIHHVYHEKEASKYLAGFAKFAGLHQDDPFIHQLLKDCFHEFIEAFVLRYEQSRQLPIGFVGSVAHHFQSILKECLDEKGCQMGEVMKTPMEGLIRRYS